MRANLPNLALCVRVCRKISARNGAKQKLQPQPHQANFLEKRPNLDHACTDLTYHDFERAGFHLESTIWDLINHRPHLDDYISISIPSENPLRVVLKGSEPDWSRRKTQQRSTNLPLESDVLLGLSVNILKPSVLSCVLNYNNTVSFWCFPIPSDLIWFILRIYFPPVLHHILVEITSKSKRKSLMKNYSPGTAAAVRIISFWALPFRQPFGYWHEPDNPRATSVWNT